jgi:hypothetical protein
MKIFQGDQLGEMWKYAAEQQCTDIIFNSGVRTITHDIKGLQAHQVGWLFNQLLKQVGSERRPGQPHAYEVQVNTNKGSEIVAQVVLSMLMGNSHPRSIASAFGSINAPQG